MTNYIVSKVATYQAVFASNSGAIYTFIDSNPGTTRALIAIGTSKTAAIVDGVLAIALADGLVQQGYDVAGLEYFWTSADWQALMLANIAGARTWLASNDNGLVSALAISLAVHEAIAIRLAQQLEAEGSAKLTAV